MRKQLPIRIISIVVILYMIFALSWWAILLSKKNKKVLNLQVNNINQTELSLSIKEVNRKYNAQQKMVMGEGLFFGLALVLGIWLINRSYRQEIRNATNQNNFLMAVTHELRSPIASSKLMLETFIKRDLDQANIKNLSQEGLVEIERLESNVEKILFTTKVDSNYQLFFEQIDLSVLITEVVHDLTPQFPNHQIRSNCDIKINGDKECIYSILHNLIENSLKYSSDGSEVLFIARISNNTAILQVKDHGIGIDKKERLKVLNKFYRIGSEATRKSKGTGLGLYLVNKLVQAHHGKIQIDQNQPKGTIVTIQIPQNTRG